MKYRGYAAVAQVLVLLRSMHACDLARGWSEFESVSGQAESFASGRMIRAMACRSGSLTSSIVNDPVFGHNRVVGCNGREG